MRFSYGFVFPLAALVAGCESSSTLPTSMQEEVGSPKTSSSSLSSGLAVDEPFACESVEYFRARPTVTGRLVELSTRIDAFALDGTWSQVSFWPNGRHNDPEIVSDLHESGHGDDFPLEVGFSYRYPAGTPSGQKLAHVDFEMLLRCFDETTERFILGWFDEFGFCRAGKFIVLQCDRGLSYSIP